MLAGILSLLGVVLAAQHVASPRVPSLATATSTSTTGSPSHPPAPSATTSTRPTGSIATAPITGAAVTSSERTSPTTLPTSSFQGPVPASSATASTERIETGWLSSPTAISASYLLSSASGVTVVATFTGAASLTLTSDCGGSNNTTSGASSLRIFVQGTSCTVTLRADATIPTTSYSLDLGPQ